MHHVASASASHQLRPDSHYAPVSRNIEGMLLWQFRSSCLHLPSNQSWCPISSCEGQTSTISRGRVNRCCKARMGQDRVRLIWARKHGCGEMKHWSFCGRDLQSNSSRSPAPTSALRCWSSSATRIPTRHSPSIASQLTQGWTSMNSFSASLPALRINSPSPPGWNGKYGVMLYTLP